MKKIIACILILIIMASSASAYADVDWNSMSNDQIADEINRGRAVIASRMPDDPNHLTVVNQDGIEIYLTRAGQIVENYDGKTYIQLEAVVVNGIDTEINIGDNGCCINGWAVDTAGIIQVPAGRMKKDYLGFCLTDAGISTMEEIKDMDFRLYAFSSQDFSTRIVFDNFVYVR